MKKQNQILNHNEENKVLFLFVTDKYSSLNKVKEKNNDLTVLSTNLSKDVYRY